MQEGAWPIESIRDALQAARGDGHRYDDGSILGSMCTQPHEAALLADALFSDTNLGDPDHFPGAARLEGEVLADLRDLFHAPPGAGARFLTGGTEANLYAMYIARETTGRSQVVLGEHAHFSFEKAARLLGMDLVWVPAAPDGRADVDAMTKQIGGQTALVVAVAGSTELGLVDDVPGLAGAAADAGARCHVDAAFGGYVLPFLPAAPPFDFRVGGVSSVSVDPHKGGQATIPSGVLLTRDGSAWDAVAVETPYVSTDRQAQLLGTRPGAAAAATWAVHRALGRSGYEATARRCVATTTRLADGLRRQGWHLIREPELTVVTFAAPRSVMDRLDAAGIRVNYVPRFEAIRIVVNPHVDDAAIDRLLAELGDA